VYSFRVCPPPPQHTLFPYTTLFRSVEGRGDRAFLLVAPDVQVAVISAPVGQAMDEPRISVEGEDDRTVAREQGVEIRVRQAVGRSEEHTSELQSPYELVCRLLLEKK